MSDNPPRTIPAGIQTIAREWRSDAGHHRWYVQDLATLYGLDVARYNTGNVSSASVDGEKISNTRARKLLTELDLGKLYYDVPTGRWRSQGLSDETHARLLARVTARLTTGGA